MTEASLQIPKFERNASEHIIFSYIEKFRELSQKLYRSKCRRFGGKSPPIAVLQKLMTLNKPPITEIQELFQTIIDSAFAYKQPEHRPAKPSFEPIFTESDIRQWTIWKGALKSTIELHKRHIEKLQKIQVKCWKSRSKSQEYATMVDASQLSIGNYDNNRGEYTARYIAWRGLKRSFSDKQDKHLDNVKEYDSAVEFEGRIRDKIKEFAYNLRSGITARIKARIEEGLEDLRSASYHTQCRISYDVTRLSERLYDLICKHYRFRIPPMDTTYMRFNEQISSPSMSSCERNFGNSSLTYARSDGIYTVVKNSTARNLHKDDITLKKGDRVKLLFLNSDGSRGFGWVKHSSLMPFKKWGFFQVSDIVPKRTGKINTLDGDSDQPLITRL